MGKKSLVLCSIVPLSFWVVSCLNPDKNETYEVFTAHRILKNTSSHKTTLQIFDMGQMVEIYEIEPGDSIVNIDGCSQERIQFRCSLNWAFERDSAVLIFSSNFFGPGKYQKFCSGQGAMIDCFAGFNGKSIMDLLDEGYRRRSIKKNKYFTYTIDQDDYEAAVLSKLDNGFRI